MHRNRSTMKTPVVLVTATLTVAILLAVSLLIATGTRGENAFGLRLGHSCEPDVIARIDRATQYSRAPVTEPQRCSVLDTRWSLSSSSLKARPVGGYDGR